MTAGNPVNPPELGSPSGFSHGMLVPSGSRLLFVAGQTAAEASGHITNTAFPLQFETALARVLKVVVAAGGRPEDVARMTIFVTDLDAYLAMRPALRDIWKRLMGTQYPAITLVEVKRLVDSDATVEIDATAVLPP